MNKLEVEFIIVLNEKIWGIEVKSKKNPTEKNCVCTASLARLSSQNINIIPVKKFLKMLWAHEIFGP